MPDDIYYDEQTLTEAYAVDDSATSDNNVAASKEDAATSFERRLIAVQRRLKAPKNQWNAFGKYAYRNCEDIFEGLKPLLEEYDLLLIVNNDIVFMEGFFYVKATATVTDPVSGKSISAVAFAREPSSKKGMDDSQVTGTASSYANKRALGNLFAIDDTKDADSPQEQKQKEPPAQGAFVARCSNCGTQYQFQGADQYRQFIASPGCCSNPHWTVV